MSPPYDFADADDALRRFHDLLGERRGREADQLLEAAVASFPSDPYLQHYWAMTLAATAPEAAKAALCTALDNADGDAFIIVSCAETLFQLGDLAAARAALAAITPPNTEPDPRVASRVIHLAGEFAWEAGNYEEAEKHLRHAYTVGPDVGRNGERLARFLAERGRIPEAAEIARDTRRHLPDDPALARLIHEIENKLA